MTGPGSPDDARRTVIEIARLGHDLAMVFGAAGQMAPIRPRLFRTDAERFSGVAYRAKPCSDGRGTTWVAGGFGGANPFGAAAWGWPVRGSGAGRRGARWSRGGCA